MHVNVNAFSSCAKEDAEEDDLHTVPMTANRGLYFGCCGEE